MTKKQRIIDYLIKYPNADVAKVAVKFATAKSTIYKLRKEVGEVPAVPAAHNKQQVVEITDDFNDLSKPTFNELAAEHPLFPVVMDAIKQAMFGKGERHGGNVTPFMEQPWAHYAKMHGRGFLTGQAAKKLEEAASTRSGEAFEQEVLGAIVYCGMALLKERGQV